MYNIYLTIVNTIHIDNIYTKSEPSGKRNMCIKFSLLFFPEENVEKTIRKFSILLNGEREKHIHKNRVLLP